jgi:hypothetical protein
MKQTIKHKLEEVLFHISYFCGICVFQPGKGQIQRSVEIQIVQKQLVSRISFYGYSSFCQDAIGFELLNFYNLHDLLRL